MRNAKDRGLHGVIRFACFGGHFHAGGEFAAEHLPQNDFPQVVTEADELGDAFGHRPVIADEFLHDGGGGEAVLPAAHDVEAILGIGGKGFEDAH